MIEVRFFRGGKFVTCHLLPNGKLQTCRHSSEEVRG